MKLKKKLVIITGGTKGIGYAISQEFLKNNWKVIVTGRSETLHIKKNKNRYLKFIKMDVTKENDMIRLYKEAIKWSKNINCVINCAGVSSWMPIGSVDNTFIDKIFETNIKGVIWSCKHASHYLKSGSSIINISSIASKRGSKNNSIYCASKFAVNGITQSLSRELGEKNIRVNGVCPVNILTEGLKDAFKSNYSPVNKNTLFYLKEFTKQQSALSKLPTKEDIANFCYFLASDKARYITGQSFNIDSGVMPT